MNLGGNIVVDKIDIRFAILLDISSTMTSENHLNLIASITGLSSDKIIAFIFAELEVLEDT